MAEKENRGSAGTTQYIKSDNMRRTDDNRLRTTKQEDGTDQNPDIVPGSTEDAAEERRPLKDDDEPSCAI